MKKSIITSFLGFLFLVLCQDASGILLNLSEKDIANAIKTGQQQGLQITQYVNQHYRFGKENLFRENGVIRTKWSKLAMLSGLLTAKKRGPSDQEKDRIIKSADLQIDIHTFGNKIDFAKDYSVQLIQQGKIIEPKMISADHANYLPEKKTTPSGFPKYFATVRCFFSYNQISLNEKAEIVLIKDRKKVVFEVNFADYK